MTQPTLPPKEVEIGDDFDPNDRSDFGGGPDAAFENPAAAPSDTDQFEDYWGSNVTETFMLPDGKQSITYKKLNEGERTKYQKQINQDITVERNSGNARMRVDQATARHALLQNAVVDWTMKRRSGTGWLDIPFSIGSPGSNFNQWLNATDPGLVDDLEKAVRKLNPWLTAELGVKEIDEMIADLQSQREDAVRRDTGN